MSLFAPILRLCLLFLNVYSTFKCLKPPRVSSRSRTGLPSQTSVMQRKRDMKGCLAVWVVWTCLATYERHFERIISLFIPFYDEFKAMVLLFLITTRARGAEPIFLHVIRPLVRPYTATIDTVLDLLRMIGDIIYALSSFFLHSVTNLSQSAHNHLPASLQVFSPFTYFNSSLPVPFDPYRSHNFMQEVVMQNGEHPGFYEVTLPPRAPTIGIPPSSYPYPGSHNTIEGLPVPNDIQNGGTIFIPPLPEEIPLQTNTPDSNGHAYPPLPPSPHAQPSTAVTPLQPAPSREDAWDWDWDARQYPSFPSAYPPTPLTTNSCLPSTRNSKGKGKMRLVKDPWRQPDGTVLEEVVEEDQDVYDHTQSSRGRRRRRNEGYSENQQGFHQSLLPPRKPLNPGFGARGLSDDLRGSLNKRNKRIDLVSSGHDSDMGLGRFAGTSSGIHKDLDDSESDVGDAEADRRALAGIGANEGMDVDSFKRGLASDSELDSDGSFNITLRTPRAPLPPSGSAASIMTLKSTVRTRASARSLFASRSTIHASPLSAVDVSIDRKVGDAEEENNLKSEVSSRSSSRSRATGLTTTNDEGSTRTLSSGSASVESLALASSASISVSDSSLEEAMKLGGDVIRRTVRVGQKRRHEISFSQDPEGGSSSAVGTARRGKRLARSKFRVDVERLTTEDEGDDSHPLTTSRRGRSALHGSRHASRGPITVPEPATSKAGASSLTTLPLRKRRKVDPIPSHSTELRVGSSDENSVQNARRGGKPQTRAAAPTSTTTRPKRPMTQRSEGSKTGAATITQSKPPTTTRSSSGLRRGESSESSASLQP
ncbi:hypothetical protein E1B28_004825 [Marasmius oreades]|uniref:Protein YOP1 n=1 Tax=Marasmius oreades TaxID=181124 RepID=A0A9P8ADH6_9AGAR|nr:uncharacterized protein E1B28_004825 [Marasmius oreades]KAG7097483.1 hypothetical protein E1B28_004825 [Marasmius oreades]